MEDFLDGGIETAMAFKGLPIGVGNGLAQHDGFLLSAGDAPAAPGCEHTAGAVEQVLLPGGRNHLDAAAGVAELVPKLAVGGLPGPSVGGGPGALGVKRLKESRSRQRPASQAQP